MRVLAPVVASWSLALLSLRLVGPRPRFRRLARQPGLIAGFALLLSLAFSAVPLLIRALVKPAPTIYAEVLGWCILTLPAATTLASWMTLAVSGAWRPEPDWVDRFGRTLGVVWIVIGSSVLVYSGMT
jgi:hypothetical protein